MFADAAAEEFRDRQSFGFAREVVECDFDGAVSVDVFARRFHKVDTQGVGIAEDAAFEKRLDRIENLLLGQFVSRAGCVAD